MYKFIVCHVFYFALFSAHFVFYLRETIETIKWFFLTNLGNLIKQEANNSLTSSILWVNISPVSLLNGTLSLKTYRTYLIKQNFLAFPIRCLFEGGRCLLKSHFLSPRNNILDYQVFLLELSPHSSDSVRCLFESSFFWFRLQRLIE